MSRPAKAAGMPGELSKPQNILVVDSEDPQVAAHGNWTQVADRDASYLTYIYSNTPGDYIEYTFKGTGLWLRVYLSSDAGKAKISIDGSTPITIDLYASDTRLHTPFVHSNLTPNTKHTVKIEVDSAKNASSSDYKIGVDAFIIELSKGAMQIWAMIETAITTVSPTPYYTDVIPQTDLTYTLGDSSRRWLELYLQYLKFVNLTSDPSSPDVGDVWYRSDLEKPSIKRATVIDRFVLETLAQTLTNKTLTTPIIASLYQASGGNLISVPAAAAADIVVLLAETQTLLNKTLTTPTIADLTNMTHNHQNAAGGAQLDHGLALTGLTDDDHTQYVLRSILTTHGDIFFRDGSVIARLAPGTSGQFLKTQGSGADPVWSNVTTKQALFANVRDIGWAVATYYFGFGGDGERSGTEKDVEVIAPFAGTLKNFYVRLGTTMTAGDSLVITVRIEGADTSITVTFTVGEQTENDTVNTASVSAGDRLSIKVVYSGGAYSSSISCGLEFDPS